MIPKISNDKIIVLMIDNKYHSINISELKKFITDYEKDAQDFDDPISKIMWDFINEIIETDIQLTDWEKNFIDKLSLQPKKCYSLNERNIIRKIYEKKIAF